MKKTTIMAMAIFLSVWAVNFVQAASQTAPVWEETLWGPKSSQSSANFSDDQGWDWQGSTWLTVEQVDLEGEDPQTNYFAGSLIRVRPKEKMLGLYLKLLSEWYENGCQTLGVELAPELTVGLAPRLTEDSLQFAVGVKGLNRHTHYSIWVWDGVKVFPVEHESDETVTGYFAQLELNAPDSPKPRSGIYFRLKGESLPRDSQKVEGEATWKPRSLYLHFQAEKTLIVEKEVPLRNKGTYEATEGRIGFYPFKPFLIYYSLPNYLYNSDSWRVSWEKGWGLGTEIEFSSAWKLHASYKNLNRVDSDLKEGEWEKNEERGNIGLVWNW